MGSKTDGAWAYANVGVFVAFAVGFIGWLLLGRSTVARQESARARHAYPRTCATST